MNSPPRSVLNSWKEISVFLGRGVRTIQRWEQKLHLPVHRVGTGSRAPVFAFEHELRFWLQAGRIGAGNSRAGLMGPRATHQKIAHEAAGLGMKLMTLAQENRRLTNILAENLLRLQQSREGSRRSMVDRKITRALAPKSPKKAVGTVQSPPKQNAARATGD